MSGFHGTARRLLKYSGWLLGYPGWLLGPLLGYPGLLLRCCYEVARVLGVVARSVARVPRPVARVLGVVARAVARVPRMVAKVLLCSC